MVVSPIKILTPALKYSLPEDGTVNISNEFMEHLEATQPFDSFHRLAVVERLDGSVIVFSIGNDDSLYMIYDRQAHDISRKNQKAVTFDVYQRLNENSFTVVVATQSRNANINDPKNVYQANVEMSDSLNINWEERPSQQTPAKVTTLSLSSTDCIAGVVGARNEYSSTFSNPVNDNGAWTLRPIPEDSDAIQQVIPGNINGHGVGIYVLYQIRNTERQGIAFMSNDLGSIVRYSMPHLICYDMAAVEMDFGKGLAYFFSEAEGTEPSRILLPTIECRQVVAHVSGIITSILVVSSSDDLYYIRRNDLGDEKYEFICSELPIRPGVKALSVQSNLKANTADVVLLSKSGSLIHFWKDLQTTLWNERQIDVVSTDKFQKYPAYVTTCTVVDAESSAKGNAVVQLFTTQSVYVTINNVSERLTQEPKFFNLDSSGRLTLVMRTPPSLGSVQHHMKVEGKEVVVEPAQRVISKLAYTQDMNLLKDAKSTTREQIFANCKDEDLMSGLKALKSFPEACNSKDPIIYKQLGLPNVAKPQSDSTSAAEEKTIFLTEIANDIGDVLQCIGVTSKKA